MDLTYALHRRMPAQTAAEASAVADGTVCTAVWTMGDVAAAGRFARRPAVEQLVVAAVFVLLLGRRGGPFPGQESEGPPPRPGAVLPPPLPVARRRPKGPRAEQGGGLVRLVGSDLQRRRVQGGVAAVGRGGSGGEREFPELVEGEAVHARVAAGRAPVARLPVGGGIFRDGGSGGRPPLVIGIEGRAGGCRTFISLRQIVQPEEVQGPLAKE